MEDSVQIKFEQKITNHKNKTNDFIVVHFIQMIQTRSEFPNSEFPRVSRDPER